MMPIALPSPYSAERSRLLSTDLVRQRALERLYRRREAVESLIRSLEDYQRIGPKAQPIKQVSTGT